MRLLTCGTVFALVLSAGAPAAAAQWQVERTIDQRVETGAAGSIVVDGDNGDVHLIPTATNAITIHARIRMHDRSALANASVGVKRSGNQFEVDGRCPRASRLFGYTNDCEVEDTIEYPQGMALDVEWTNGDVRVTRPQSDVTVHLTNGDVEVHGAIKSVALSTRHGNVEASLASGWHGKAIALAVSEGDVVLAVPRRFNGYLDASVRIGDIGNDARLPTSAPNANSVAVRATALIGDITVRN